MIVTMRYERMLKYGGIGLVIGAIIAVIVMKFLMDTKPQPRPAPQIAPPPQQAPRAPATKAEAVAQALNEKGCVFYSSEGCQWCDKQKAEFGDSFKDVKNVDCGKNPDQCNGLKGVPHWKCADGSEKSGYAGLDDLAEALEL